MNILKNKIMQRWGLMRIIRLVLAVIVLAEAWRSNEVILGLLGVILLAQSVFNVACCGSSGCDIDHTQKKQGSLENSKEEVTFIEIKKLTS